MKNKVSDKTVQEAMAAAKATTKPGQTKEQTKLIAQGIQKGIEQYKKLQKAKKRDADKVRKQKLKQQADVVEESNEQNQSTEKLPWVLLGLSWVLFVGYVFLV